MKQLLLIAFMVFPFFVFSQTENIEPKNNIGLSTEYGYYGISSKLTYERAFGKRHAFNISLFGTGKQFNGIELGYRFKLLEYKRIQLFTGLEYRNMRLDNRVFDGGKRKVRSFGLPLELRIKLTNRFSLFAQVSMPLYNNDDYRFSSSENRFVERFNLGIKFRW